MHRVLFVDDEPKILTGLRRMLRSLRHEWEMEFAESGQAALAILASASFDVIVSDARMPRMEGSELLSEVQKDYPDTARVILSGQCSRSSVLKCVGVAHQFLSKPCNSESLIRAIRQVCRLRDCVPAMATRVIVSRMTCLPSRADMYASLANQMSSATTSEKSVADTIARDVAMTLKMMQLVSSGFFGSPQRGVDVVRAVELLGIEMIRELMPLSNAFRLPAVGEISDVRIQELSEHGVAVATAARRIAETVTDNRQAICESYVSGLLHQIGSLALAAGTACTPQRADSLKGGNGADKSYEARSPRNSTGSDAGGYLAALWGLPEAIVLAIGNHRSPGNCQKQAFGPLAAVHVAHVLLRQPEEDNSGEGGTVDIDYLRSIGCADRLNDWRAICHEVELEEVFQ